MNEVEKMYKNAGIKSKAECTSKVCIVTNPHKDWCNKCESLKYKYPPFTAEKQIAILQLLTQQCDLIISHFTEWEFIHFDGQEPLQITGKDFTETFAKLINAYWQDLTDAEKVQIKEILE